MPDLSLVSASSHNLFAVIQVQHGSTPKCRVLETSWEGPYLHNPGDNLWPGHSLKLSLREAQLISGEVANIGGCPHVNEEVHKVVQPVCTEYDQIDCTRNIPESKLLSPGMPLKSHLSMQS